jgi:hypothetical protein
MLYVLEDGFMSLNEEVQRHIKTMYLDPARRRGESTIRIKAGDVHRDLHWVNRVPSVCTTLSSKKFQRETGLELVSKEGPPSGFGTRVEFTYRLHDQEDRRTREPGRSRFEALYGKLSDVFRELGGGEDFLRNEKEQLHFRKMSETSAPGKDKI